jgi:hypothetical protein
VVSAGVSEVMSRDLLDHSVYPDMDEPPIVLETVEAKADYVHRICAAWDYGVHPEPETFTLFARWKEVFDRFPVLTSPAYHAFRARFQWEPSAFPLNVSGPRLRYRILDELEGRGEDPCEQMI